MNKEFVQNTNSAEKTKTSGEHKIAEKAFELLQTFPFSFVENRKIIGDMFSLAKFMNNVECGAIIDDDGCIGSIFVNGSPTNINVVGWSSGWGNASEYKMKLEELKSINGNVEIEWCNK